MALSFKNKLKYNLYLWYFGLTKVRLIHFIRPKIIDVNKEGVTLFMPLDRRKHHLGLKCKHLTVLFLLAAPTLMEAPGVKVAVR